MWFETTHFSEYAAAFGEVHTDSGSNLTGLALIAIVAAALVLQAAAAAVRRMKPLRFIIRERRIRFGPEVAPSGR